MQLGVTTAQLIFSLAAILLATRIFGWLAHRIGQPQVVGEMIAGIVLGPSLFARFFPGYFADVFPTTVLPALTVLSQLGLLLFMFAVGLEVDLGRILKQKSSVVLISNVSIILPLLLGVALAKMLYPQFAGEKMSFISFALFMGTAMSVTAFPVLARILKELNMLGTELGTMSISCAAIDDISAWLLLAILTAIVKSSQSWHQFALIALYLAIFIFVMLVPVSRLAAFWEFRYQKIEAGMGTISLLILFMLASSWTTEKLGVHALFGAFMAGLVIPKNGDFTTKVVDRIESVSLAVLLPLFFALTGLRTRIDLLTDKTVWGYALVIVATAVVGKLAGAAFTARAMGMGWKNSFGLG
ncbi:MAG TPA: cation:proton antiporter, partial [Terriglobales bacterium]|nr:cation:proton antiporter [Terriglobales bacterium]